MTVYKVSHDLLQRWHVGPSPSQQRHNSMTSIIWLRAFVEDVDRRVFEQPLHPVVQSLNTLIESNAGLRMLASAMFDEIPNKSPYREDSREETGRELRPHASTLQHHRDGGSSDASRSRRSWPGPWRRAADMRFFLRKDVNERFRAILNTWRDDVLTTSKSRWLAVQDANAERGARYSFAELFACTPEEDSVHWGFKSWDGFFTRQFRDIDKVRPVGRRHQPEWVVSACESRPYELQTNVRAYDSFWLKGSRYSVMEMLDHHELAASFVGGTVFQSFLHSDIVSPLVRACIRPRRRRPSRRRDVLSEATFVGFSSPSGPDPSGPNLSQALPVDSATACPSPWRRGKEIGRFRHGGSSHCLLLRKGLGLCWVPGAMLREDAHNLLVRSELAYGYAEGRGLVAARSKR
ncbi:hypothetical protein LLEC1_01774, partial [Akanthomyces lecanii]